MRKSIPLLFIAFMCACSDSNNNSNTGGNGSDMAASMPTCDIVKQDCPSGQKCVPKVKGADQTVVGSTCVTNGTIAEGQPCATNDSNSSLLNDNCVAGTMCDDTGPNVQTVCRKFCNKTTACSTAGQQCAAAYTDSWGLCLTSCTPFGNDCPQGNDCSPAFDAISTTPDSGVFTCKLTGSGTAYSHCESNPDCGANLGCDFDHGWCVPVCDNTHACAQPPNDGGTVSCLSYANLPTGAGICG